MESLRATCLTVVQTAELLGVSRATIFRLARAGELPHTRIASALRFRREDIEAYVNGRTTREWLPGERTNRGPEQLAKLPKPPATTSQF